MIPEPTAENATWIIAEVGAVNWGLQEFLNFNLVTDLGLPPSLSYGIIGAAGVVALADKFGGDIFD